MIHRFEIALADVDRGVYADLDVRVARHPSEDVPYLLTRVLAFALEHQEGLQFSKGLSESDEPALWRKGPDGRVLDWIEVGSPTPERLHRANKHAERVVVYCHRRPDILRQKCAKEGVHEAERVRLVVVPGAVLDALAGRLDRNNRWAVSVHDGHTTIVCGDTSVEAVFEAGPLVPAAQ
ncbi:MAG: YaeQ family protein [Planctomycetes bacterium]|nr:YaeQ family protein [Planctomycetota bacterium]